MVLTTPSGSGNRRRGSVIVVVLVTVMLAAYLLMRIIESSTLEMLVATREADRNRLRGDATDAMELALAVMAEVRAIDDDKLFSPEQGWGDPFEYSGMAPREGVEIAFAFEDESAKLSLPNLTQPQLIDLAERLGLARYDAERFADALLAWINPQHVPTTFEVDASAYERAPLPHHLPRRSLRSFEELRAIAVVRDFVYDPDGRLTSFGEAFRNCVSLYQFESTNINSASSQLLAARGLDQAHVGFIELRRSGDTPRPPGTQPYFRSLDEVRALVGANAPLEGYGVEATCIRVIVTAKEGAAMTRLEALVTASDDVTFPEPFTSETASAGASANDANAPAPTPNPGPGRNNRNPAANRAPANANANATTGAEAEERLDYPFNILERREDNGPPPAPLVIETI